MATQIAPRADWNDIYVDGEWRPGESGETLDVEDPSTRERFAVVPAGTRADVDAAYEAAASAQPAWGATGPAERERVTRAVERALRDRREEIVEVLRTEAGGTTAMGETSVHLAADQLGGAATMPRRTSGRHADSNVAGKEHVVRREPAGVVTVISPWNFPLNLSMRAVAPAIAAGNSVVLKPATNTPVAGGLFLAALYDEAGLPDGVLNVVTGRGSAIGDAVAGHAESDVVAFTGSTAVGRGVGATAGENLAATALELGGNNGHVVTAEADVGRAVDAAVFGSFVHQGQVCISINRHIVHEDGYDEYVETLVERAASLPVGSAHEPDTVVGPIIDADQRDQILSYVRATVDAGATLETGGETVPVDGVGDSLVVAPTVLSDVTNDMPTAANEHFGPVAAVIPFSDVDEAVAIHDDTPYGLSGPVHAGDVGTGMAIAERLDTGMVHVGDQPINDEAHVPFSGRKASGVGGYNTDEILDTVTETKWISLQHRPREFPF
ncbi:MAG: aldehyde dehydrogenase family protein [Halobacteriaceae archaeon]